MLLEPGSLVRVRSRQYLVEEVSPPPSINEQTLVRLSCIDDDSQGTQIEVLWEKEVDRQIIEASSWKNLTKRGFDSPKQFSAYLHTLRWNLVTSTNPRLFQAPYRAGIQIKAYQLEPLRKALQLPRVNLFIADDVGLGKTIEAGLILRELIIRQKVRTIVVACPPSVILQWKDELENRFGLNFVVFDRDYVLAKRRERGYGVNPWATHSRFIISHALLRDEAYSGPLRDWLGEFSPSSLLILDEAHNAAPASGARYAIDSAFTRVIREIARRFEHRLFLSATPHNGHSNSFAALLEILDPQRFCRGVPSKNRKILDEVMVRRLKNDLREIGEDFPVRRVIPVTIDEPKESPEVKLSNLLASYRSARDSRLKHAAKSVQIASGLVTTSLQKRLLSSIEAFALTLNVHRRAFEKRLRDATTAAASAVSESDLPLLLSQPGADDERASLSEDEVSTEELGQVEAATLQSALTENPAKEVAQLANEKTLLEEMSRLADEVRGLPDARVRWLVEWIRENMCLGLRKAGERSSGAKSATWNERRVIIFTEYADTKRYLVQQLSAAIVDTDRAEFRIATFHGGMDDESREDVKRAFNTEPKKHPLRILIATDAAREGINLQNHCADLFHFDVPWNPSRMEQRNGRIDRKLQRSPEVRCYYFVYKQRPEDRVLEVLVSKTEKIQEELGSLSPVIEKRLKFGIRRDEIEDLTAQIKAADLEKELKANVDAELEAVRERQNTLSNQLVQLQDILAKSKETLALSEDHFRAAISRSLELLKAEPLKKVTGPDSDESKVQRWKFPELDRLPGADPTWADTLDTLRPPRKRDQKFWEWRKDAPIRPVVFENLGTLDEDSVHLHLEHRVSQRLLNRFLTQGFVSDDLSRACVSQTRDAIPRVILLGRLSMYGPRASRLHDELVAVTARWSDPQSRKESLKPYSEDSEGKTLSLLEESLADPRLHEVQDHLKHKLAASAERDVTELLDHLKQRAERLATGATEKLKARGEKEAQDLAAIIQSQQKRIAEAIKKFETDRQLVLSFKDLMEVSQLEADHRHWEKRLKLSGEELANEPNRIRENYVVKATRVEPVGLVYLWPVSG